MKSTRDINPREKNIIKKKPCNKNIASFKLFHRLFVRLSFHVSFDITDATNAKIINIVKKITYNPITYVRA